MRRRAAATLKLSGVAALLGISVACGRLAETDSWMSQLHAESPCYDVNLLDGIDDEASAEAYALFDCLDRHGHLASFRHTADSLDTPTRAGGPAILELASAINHMVLIDVDPFAVAGVLVDALRADESGDAPVLPSLLDFGLELAWGRPAVDLRSGEARTDSAAALGGGVLVPLRPVLPRIAEAVLDDDLAAAKFAGDLVQSSETARLFRSVESALSSEEPAVRDPVAALLPDLGAVIEAAQSPRNDRWPDASGDSLRDLADFFVVADNPVIDAISPTAGAILGDEQVQDGLRASIAHLADDGVLEAVPAQLVWLASVDATGKPLANDTEPSALYRFVRLLADSNQPLDCSVLGFSFSLGNVAVWVLQTVADLDPGTVRDVAALLTDLTGNFLSQALINVAIDTGTCPGITHQTVDDLGALEALQQPDAAELLTAFIDVLAVLERGQIDHLPATAQLAEDLYRAGGLAPAEELLRDVGDSALIGDVVSLVPVLAHPAAYDLSGGPGGPVDLGDVLAWASWLFVVDEEVGLTGYQRARPLLASALAHDGTWEALDHAGALLRDPRSRTSRGLELLGVVLQLDPDLVVLTELGPLLADPQLAGPLLRATEAAPVPNALLADTLDENGEGPPLVFVTRLVLDGTLDDVLWLVDRALHAE